VFPSTLDNAEVLFYTPKGDYGKMYYTNGKVAAKFAYLAICKYKDSNGYYLFMCNEDYEVETDSLMDSIEECMNSIISGTNVREIEWIRKE
jgi:nuclear transport factor 2 (NTF2) superfamily protein